MKEEKAPCNVNKDLLICLLYSFGLLYISIMFCFVFSKTGKELCVKDQKLNATPEVNFPDDVWWK